MEIYLDTKDKVSKKRDPLLICLNLGCKAETDHTFLFLLASISLQQQEMTLYENIFEFAACFTFFSIFNLLESDVEGDRRMGIHESCLYTIK